MIESRRLIAIPTGTCTIALAMRIDFGDGELPGESSKKEFALSDISTFQRLYDAAKAVDKACVTTRGLSGWHAEG